MTTRTSQIFSNPTVRNGRQAEQGCLSSGTKIKIIKKTSTYNGTIGLHGDVLAASGALPTTRPNYDQQAKEAGYSNGRKPEIFETLTTGTSETGFSAYTGIPITQVVFNPKHKDVKGKKVLFKQADFSLYPERIRVKATHTPDAKFTGIRIELGITGSEKPYTEGLAATQPAPTAPTATRAELRAHFRQVWNSLFKLEAGPRRRTADEIRAEWRGLFGDTEEERQAATDALPSLPEFNPGSGEADKMDAAWKRRLDAAKELGLPLPLPLPLAK